MFALIPSSCLDSTLGKISAISNEVEGQRQNVIYEIDEQELLAIESNTGRIYNKIVFDSEVYIQPPNLVWFY